MRDGRTIMKSFITTVAISLILIASQDIAFGGAKQGVGVFLGRVIKHEIEIKNELQNIPPQDTITRLSSNLNIKRKLKGFIKRLLHMTGYDIHKI